MDSESSRKAFIEAELEREVSRWMGGMPQDRIDILREELRAILETQPAVSRLVTRVAPKVVESSGVAGEDDAADDSTDGAGESEAG